MTFPFVCINNQDRKQCMSVLEFSSALASVVRMAAKRWSLLAHHYPLTQIPWQISVLLDVYMNRCAVSSDLEVWKLMQITAYILAYIVALLKICQLRPIREFVIWKFKFTIFHYVFAMYKFHLIQYWKYIKFRKSCQELEMFLY